MLGTISPPHRRSGGSDAMHGRFSRRTVLAAIDVLNMLMVQSATSAFLIELGPEFTALFQMTQSASQSE
jgi:hypothetical protein